MLDECVPNFSEGRKTETVERLAEAIASVDTACVLDKHIDPDHNRSVITFVASPEMIVDAAVRAVGLAAELIDMRQHVGVHPRLGATDVLPFIPISGITMDECVALAHAAGAHIWQELGIPVYFYERAALRPDRANLEDVRGKGFEHLRDEIASIADRAPDIGDRRIHESAGAIAIGARPILIAFNINLRTKDLSIARQIARAVRARHGGLPFLKALGFPLETRGLVQVSMNLLNYETTGMAQAYEAVRKEAERLAVEIAGTEIVGLVPEAALDQKAEYFSRLEHFESDAVIERRIRARQKSTRTGDY
jgi:glutamate formiminotransferase